MWLINFLSSLSPGWLGFVLLGSLIGAGLTMLWAARRWILPRMNLGHCDSEFSSAAVQCAMLLYGLIAALIAVGVWQRHSQVEDTVSSEAAAISALWRDMGGYPEPTRTQSRDVLRGYTKQIIEEAWPLQAQGKTPSVGVVWMDRLQAHLFAFEPTTDGQRIGHAEVLRAFNNLVHHRRQRLDWVTAQLPPVFWVLLLPGAFVCTFMLSFFRVENVWFHALMLTIVSSFVAMVLYVIIALDRPYSGAMRITADSYQLIYDHHMSDHVPK